MTTMILTVMSCSESSSCTFVPVTSSSNGHYVALSPQHRALTTHTHTHLSWEHVGVFVEHVRVVKMLTEVPECSYRWYSICEKHISCAPMEVEFVLTHMHTHAHTQSNVQLHAPHTPKLSVMWSLWQPGLMMACKPTAWVMGKSEALRVCVWAQKGKKNLRGNLYFVICLQHSLLTLSHCVFPMHDATHFYKKSLQCPERYRKETITA